MPEPVTTSEIDTAAQGWDELRPEHDDPEYLVGRGAERAAQVRGLREFADLMEARPDLPLPARLSVPVFLRGTGSEMNAQLEYASELLGQPADEPYEGAGMSRVTRDVGTLHYRIVAMQPLASADSTPAFAVGQPVRLTAEAAHVAETARLAQAGTVVGTEPAPDGTCTYTVHFPGRTGTQRGWTESALAKAPPFAPVTISTGEVTSLQAAEELLIERGAEIKLHALSVRQPGDALLGDHYRLTDEVSRACGLSGAELLRQIGPQVEEKVRGHVTAHGLQAPPTAPELAAADGQHVTAVVEEVPAQRDGQAPPKRPDAAEVRGKAR